MDACAEFIQSFEGNERLTKIAKTIVHVLGKDRDLPLENDDHPFNLYSSEDDVNFLKTRVLDALEGNINLKPYVNSFFHSSGAYFDDLYDVLDPFWEMVDVAFTDPNEDEDTDDDDTQQQEIEIIPDIPSVPLTQSFISPISV